MPEPEQGLTEDYVAELLKKEARETSSRYSVSGISAFLPQRRPNPAAPKPNLRFLNSIIRETDTHNAALKLRELEHAGDRLRELRGDPPRVKGRHDGDVDAGSHSDRHRPHPHQRRSRRMSDDGGEVVSGRGARSLSPRRRTMLSYHGTDASDYGHRERRAADDGARLRARSDAVHRRREKESKADGSLSSSGEARKRHRQHRDREKERRHDDRHGYTEHSDEGISHGARIMRRQQRRHEERDSQRRPGMHRSRSRSRSPRSDHEESRRRQRRRSPKGRRDRRHRRPRSAESHSTYDGDHHDQHRLRHHRSHRLPSRPEEAQSETHAVSRLDSGQLSDTQSPGPKPPPEPSPAVLPPANVVRRGRGQHTASLGSSAMDAHFSSSYNPELDATLVTGSSTAGGGGDYWEQALEALRDRASWQRVQADRLRAAGFSDVEISRWERGGAPTAEGAEADIKWKGTGEGREWDRGKVAQADGTFGAEADWARLKDT